MTDRNRGHNTRSHVHYDADCMDEYYEDEVVRDINEDLEEEDSIANVDADEERDYPVDDWEGESVRGQEEDVSGDENDETPEGMENAVEAVIPVSANDIDATLPEDDTHSEATHASISEDHLGNVESAQSATKDEVANEDHAASSIEITGEDESASIENSGDEPHTEQAHAEVVTSSAEEARETPLASGTEASHAHVSADVESNPMTTLWAKGYSHFIIAKHLGLSTKQVRDDIEALGLSESQGKLDLPESHAYWKASLPEKREIERQLLSAENA